MKTMLLATLSGMLIVGGILSGCGAPLSRSINTDDGAYLVKRFGDNSAALMPLEHGEQMVIYDYKIIDPATDEPLEYVVIDLSKKVPLELAKDPEGQRQSDGRLSLLIQLTDDASETLEAFTTENLGGRIAMVIGGRIVTMHKIREVIKGGGVQITRCTDDACEQLLLQLKK